MKRKSEQNSQYSNVTTVLDCLLRLQIFPLMMYCTVQGEESTDSTLVNCSLGHVFINYVTHVQVVNVSNLPKLPAASDNYWKKFTPNTGKGIHIYSQQSLSKFPQLHLLLNLYISCQHFWTLAASKLTLETS